MALGHNPGWEDAVRWLTGKAVGLGTAYAALLTCPDGGTWRSSLRAESFTIASILEP